MAEAAIGYVLKKLADASLQKAQELHAVSGQIKQMQLQLGFIKAYLRDADSKGNRDESVKEWINQIRHMAHRIEDVIDTFLVEIEENHQKSSQWYSKIPVGLKRPYNNLKLSGELEEITLELKTIFQLRIDLGIKDLGAGSEENGQHQLSFRPTKPFAFDDSQVVGLEDDKRKIIEQLLDRIISRRMVLSIVGTGGLGKTTLAQKIYKSVNLEGQFDHLAWLSISQKFNLNDLFREILYSIKPEMRNQNPPLTDDDLPVNIESTLRDKRFLIILDDVWTTDLWEQMKIAIPDRNNMSRIIITSRFEDVANTADCNTEPYQLSYLNSNESLALLFRKAFQQPIQPENYPLDLLEVATRLTKKSGGLPLALVVLGGILSKRKRNYTAWRTMEETMDWHDEDGKKCSQN
ncbi:Disease resistance protein RPP13 [Carex littledalei]|uniref:Disease resistance protein RPP13 n=1 Tax=Carex littledalei TaxID=544730 RepID=A0A833R1G8_9POAL|nr:Disease resistance protein RPP13 [Carex littledalei]